MKVYRQKWLRPVIGLAMIGFTIMWVSVAITGPEPSRGHPDFIDRVVPLGFNVFTIAFYYVLGRPRLTADELGIEARNYLSTRRMAWRDIDGFELREGASWAQANLRDGTTLGLHALQPARITWLLRRPSRAHSDVEELNMMLRDHSN